MSVRPKLLEEVHPLTVIREVQKWPVLYSKDSRERGNKHFKSRVWREVAESVFMDWDNFTDAEKDGKVTDLIKRWRNLRDTFKRQVEIDKKVKEGHENKKKPYVYFNDMEFLLPHMGEEEVQQDARERPKRRLVEDLLQESVSVSKIKRSRVPEIEEVDEDKHFVLSLIPTLKKLPDEEKLTIKMQILQVLRDGRRRCSQITTSPDNQNILFMEESGTDALKIEATEEESSEE